MTQSEEVGVHEAFIIFRGSEDSTQPVPQSLLYSSIMYDLDNLQWGDYGGDYGGVVQINLRNK